MGPGWILRPQPRRRNGDAPHKSLGLGVRYKDGRLMPVDDPKLDPIWAMCAQYDRPVEIHTADPGAFFTPLDRLNER